MTTYLKRRRWLRWLKPRELDVTWRDDGEAREQLEQILREQGWKPAGELE